MSQPQALLYCNILRSAYVLTCSHVAIWHLGLWKKWPQDLQAQMWSQCQCDVSILAVFGANQEADAHVRFRINSSS